jgi:hypothetical protein
MRIAPAEVTALKFVDALPLLQVCSNFYAAMVVESPSLLKQTQVMRMISDQANRSAQL